MMCVCTGCLIEAAIRLLRSGRVNMGTLLLEQALRLERERAERERPPVEAPPPRACQAEARP
jgi:hypothetical protein